MTEALLHSFSNILILVTIAGFGWYAGKKHILDANGRITISRLVNYSIPCCLFYSVTSKFSHDQLLELLMQAWLPFASVALSVLVSLAFVRAGLVRKEIEGVFISCFTGSTVIFVGIPVIAAIFGEEGIPYLLMYFLANCTFNWTFGLYGIKRDGVHRIGAPEPRLFSAQSFKMLFAPPILSFLAGIAVVLFYVPLPPFVTGTAKMFGAITSPLALFFIGMTIQKVGLAKLRHIPREVKWIMLSCFVIRPFIMYVITMPLDCPDIMRRALIISCALPVSSVIAVMARQFGGDEEFASEAISITTIALIFTLPVMLFLINFV